ncbi:MAG: N-succinylarginine dihydrolase [Planctomycetota bacterium]
MGAQEFNFDGLVGPTHNYAGLSHGNVASKKHQNLASSPKKAALQGLQKMRFVRDLGIPQCILPPLPRPHLELLRNIGFAGNDHQMIIEASKVDPVLVAICFSASNMWTANAATISPSSDCEDGRVHLTPANLSSNLHRSIEAVQTTQVLRSIFHDVNCFHVHDPLPSNAALSDEGAANHTRFCTSPAGVGIEVFAYGCQFLNPSARRPAKFPARQTLESTQAIARRHQLKPENTFFLQQNPDAIDSGVFHNDVIAVGHQNVLLCHELAYQNQEEQLKKLQDRFTDLNSAELHIITIPKEQLSFENAVQSYLFNSQLLNRPGGGITLICPADCQENQSAFRCTESILSNKNPIDDVHFLDLRQSMNNGGGPACLRLRVTLTSEQQESMLQSVLLTDTLYDELVAWVESHYREELTPMDLLDPHLLSETKVAFQELSTILSMPCLANM